MNNFIYQSLLKSSLCYRINPSLKQIKRFINKIANPQNSLDASCIIAGTNGKASTSYSLYFLMRNIGLNVGLYTSPHIFDFRERIIYNDRKIKEQEIKDIYRTLCRLKEFNELTFYEKMTAISFIYFKEMKPDFTIFEVGMGGRWDAVRVIPSKTVFLVNVSIDHLEYLGKDRKTILLDKAFITHNREEAIIGFRMDRNSIKSERCYCYGEEFYFNKDNQFILFSEKTDFGYPEYLPPLYKSDVASALFYLTKNFNKRDVVRSFKKTVFKFPARFDFIRTNVILDIAHNPEAFFYLMKELLSRFSGNISVVFGICKDKEIELILPILKHKRIKVIVYEPEAYERTLQKKDLIKLLEKYRILYYDKICLKELRKEDCLCITGSIMTVSKFCREYGYSPSIFWNEG
ncbi:MAG: Mur ligase family protein [Candidatus Hydrogenedentota bacterium]